MPTIPSITTSVENQQTLILDSHAKKGAFSRDARGRLIKHSGGFTVVYPYTLPNGEKWAFRCWHSELGDVRKRFEIISTAIQNAKLPYLCDFIYVDKGISVEGKVYPTTRMRWVEGTTIKEYICSNFQSKTKLLSLADQFLHLVRDMHKHSLAHGDLQHGNILVGDDGKLYLVDYDSFYCPQLSGEKDIITGLKDYQHPSRSKNKYVSEKLDYFSEIIIYLSILGIAYNSSLCSKYKMADTEHMLFESKDYENIDASNIYKELIGLNAIFKPLLDVLKLYISKNSIQDLEPFDILLDKITKAPEIRRFYYRPDCPLYVGDQIKLIWNVIGSKQIFINGHEIEGGSCERTLLSVGVNSFTLRALNDYKESSSVQKIEANAEPKIEINSNTQRIRKGKEEECVIKWHVENATDVILEYGASSENVGLIGEKHFKLEETTTFYVKAIGLGGKRIWADKLVVGVYEEAVVEFFADKKYTLPEIPVELKWHVLNALDVELKGFGKVKSSDAKSVRVGSATIFSLIVTDEFGTKEKQVEVRMLPLPQITSINIPIPEFSHTMNVKVNIPKMDLNMHFPQIRMFDVDISMPQMLKIDKAFPSFDHLERTGVLGELKSLFIHYYNKLRNGK